jgi:hypothetical protein
MSTITEEEVKAAINKILKDRNNKVLNYAINYSLGALEMTGYELRVQCRYILNNLQYWRNPDAAEVRTILKQFSKRLK